MAHFDISLSRNKGAISLSSTLPDHIPEQLKNNINKISIKELKKICDIWNISRKGKTRVAELRDVILKHFKVCLEEKTQKVYKLGELFAGTGGFSHAFNGLAKSVFANDKEISCKSMFDANFPDTKLVIQDINDLSIHDIPDIDILTFGSPCQSFSIAGQRKGFKDPRGNVFWRIIEILNVKQPKVFIMENVKNLQSHDSGKTFKIMLEEFFKIGYHTSHKVLNTCKYTNIPQNRERIFVIGFLNKSLSDKFKFPIPLKTGSMTPLVDFLESDGVDDSKYYYSDNLKVWPLIKKYVTRGINTNTIYQYRRTIVRENKNNVCPTLTANMGGGGHNVPLLKDKKGIRKLTPKECFKLQGFPDDLIIPKKLSNTALYKMAGNAITVKLVKLLAIEIIKVLNFEESTDSEELTKHDIRQLFISYKTYCFERKKIYDKKSKKSRLPNFPEDISENIVRQFIIQKENIKCKYVTKNGDLEKIFENHVKKIEVKCFASDGPTSFGPSEKWDEIYFLNAKLFMDDKIQIFKINIPNNDIRFKNLKINAKQTYYDQCKQNRRPRIKFSNIQKQFENDNDFKEVYNGSILELL